MKSANDTVDIEFGSVLSIGADGTPLESIKFSLDKKNIQSYWLSKERTLQIIQTLCLIFFFYIIVNNI